MFPLNVNHASSEKDKKIRILLSPTYKSVVREVFILRDIFLFLGTCHKDNILLLTSIYFFHVIYFV